MRIKYIISVLLAYRCACSLCRTETLSHAIEYRCCREVGPTLHQLTFDGSIEKITCITLHEEYEAMIHPTVLKNVGPLFKGQRWKIIQAP